LHGSVVPSAATSVVADQLVCPSELYWVVTELAFLTFSLRLVSGRFLQTALPIHALLDFFGEASNFSLWAEAVQIFGQLY
jgi:hypothetical protein